MLNSFFSPILKTCFQTSLSLLYLHFTRTAQCRYLSVFVFTTAIFIVFIYCVLHNIIRGYDLH